MKHGKVYVIGTKVRTSLSPTIFKYWFKKHNIDGYYGYKEIHENSFDKEIKPILQEEEVCGLNITMPFKEKIIPYLNLIDHHSKKIGAVNNQDVHVMDKEFVNG